jgi:[citrate (pro-3S)-lyase] ligase
MSYIIKKLRIDKDYSIKKDWEDLLFHGNIRPEKAIEYTAGIFEGDNLIATGSIFQNILKCIAVAPEYMGGKVFNVLISHLMSEVFDKGYVSCFIYTKEEAAHSFMHLGFCEIARVSGELVFLELSAKGFLSYIEDLKKTRIEGNKVASIVMNANPFTNGHLHLIETAVKENDVLHVFILSEELSDFPSRIRLELVKKGTAHLHNIILHETGDYIISAKTFPSYFLKEKADITYIQASLDAVIFKSYISASLGISRRYVGEEPLSQATAIYNQALKDVFNEEIELIVIPRKEIANEVISASRVRKLFKENHMEQIKNLVPKSTFEFLLSPEGRKIQDKIQEKEV